MHKKRRDSRRPLGFDILEDRTLPTVVTGLSWPTDTLWNNVQTGDFAGNGIQETLFHTAGGAWQIGPSGQVGSRFGYTSQFNYDPFAVVGDFNGDGKDDIAAMAGDGTWLVGLSDGVNFNTTSWGKWSTAPNWQFVVAGDFNGDGKTDIAAMNTGGTWYVGLSTGHGFDVQPWGQWTPGKFESVLVGDFTGDGRDDIAGIATDGSIWVDVASPQGFINTQWTTWNTTNNYVSYQVGDFNGDGHADIAALSTDGTWTVGLATAHHKFQTQTWAKWSPTATYSDVVVGDFNGDGHTDVAALDDQGQLWVGQSLATGGFMTSQINGGTSADWQGLVAGNFLGARKDQIVGFRTSGDWWVTSSTGSTLNTQLRTSWPEPTVEGPISPWQDSSYWNLAQTGDFQGNGSDQLFGFADGEAWLGQPNNQQIFSDDDWQTNGSFKAVLTGNFSGTGDEIAAFGRDGNWYIVNSQGGAAQVSGWGRWSTGTHWSQLFTGDVNGDGLTDVIGLNNDGSWYVGLSTGHGFITERWAAWQPASHWNYVGVGDFNGDGKTDIIGVNNDGGLWVGTSVGYGFRTTGVAMLVPGSHWQGFQVGDFTGAGRDDIMGVTTSGQWWLGAFNDGVFYGQTLGYAPGVGTITDLWHGDFTGDGAQDLLVAGADGTLWVGSLAGGAFHVKLWYQGPAHADWSTLKVGDFNGDGRDDIAAFGINGQPLLWFGLSTNSRFSVTKSATDEISPFSSAAPFATGVSKSLFDSVPVTFNSKFYYNNSATYLDYLTNYQDVLRGWIQDFDAQELSNAQLAQYILNQLNTKFNEVKGSLAQTHPGLTDEQYRILMTMNLVHGFYVYASRYYTGTSLADLLRMDTGDCSEYATLTAALLNVQGISSQVMGWITNYNSNLGPVVSSHCVCLADGMLIDSLTNIAINLGPDSIATVNSIAPDKRLSALVGDHDVYGFYNWFLKPEVREYYVRTNQDAGVIPFFYQYYFTGINQGSSLVSTVPFSV